MQNALNQHSIIIDCSNYKQICEAPAQLELGKGTSVLFKMERMSFIQSDELTHLRCLFDLALYYHLHITVNPPQNDQARLYSEGMKLFTGFTLPGTPFPNGARSSYIPLTKVTSDKNDFLYDEFLKIFNSLRLPSTVVPSLCLAFTEIADNIFYHSGYNGDSTGWGYIAAQVYRNRVQMSFTDTGIGFEKAYERSGTRLNRTCNQLLKDSLKYLESRFNLPGQRKTRGVGLHEAADLAKTTGGRLTLRSAAGMITLSGNGPIQESTTPWLFCGSQISMVIPI